LLWHGRHVRFYTHGDYSGPQDRASGLDQDLKLFCALRGQTGTARPATRRSAALSRASGTEREGATEGTAKGAPSTGAAVPSGAPSAPVRLRAAVAVGSSTAGDRHSPSAKLKQPKLCSVTPVALPVGCAGTTSRHAHRRQANLVQVSATTGTLGARTALRTVVRTSPLSASLEVTGRERREQSAPHAANGLRLRSA